MTEVTPFDLHVLSTPPAFVLSQNQTLHNIFLEIAGPMNHFSDSPVPCNLAPKFLRTSSRRRPRHASRPFPSLSLSSPAPHPEGCTRWRVFQLRRSTQKVCKLENCLARLASRFSFEPLSLSSCTVSVCRESYQNRRRTSSQFF